MNKFDVYLRAPSDDENVFVRLKEEEIAKLRSITDRSAFSLFVQSAKSAILFGGGTFLFSFGLLKRLDPEPVSIFWAAVEAAVCAATVAYAAGKEVADHLLKKRDTAEYMLNLTIGSESGFRPLKKILNLDAVAPDDPRTRKIASFVLRYNS